MKLATDPLVPVLYDVTDLARMIACSEDHVLRLSRQGAIPGRISGIGRRLVRFARPAVDSWLSGRRPAA